MDGACVVEQWQSGLVAAYAGCKATHVGMVEHLTTLLCACVFVAACPVIGLSDFHARNDMHVHVHPSHTHPRMARNVASLKRVVLAHVPTPAFHCGGAFLCCNTMTVVTLSDDWR